MFNMAGRVQGVQPGWCNTGEAVRLLGCLQATAVAAAILTTMVFKGAVQPRKDYTDHPPHEKRLFHGLWQAGRTGSTGLSARGLFV